MISGWKVATIVSMDDTTLDLLVTYETPEDEAVEDLNAIANEAMGDDEAEGGATGEKHVQLALGDLITPKLLSRRRK